MASLLVTESIALRAASELKLRDGGRLRERFPSFFKNGKDFKNEIDFNNEKDAYAQAMERIGGAERILRRMKDVRVRNLEGEGLLAALWFLAEEEGCGLEIDASAIPILQETVEICEFLDVDPYSADSGGALAAVCPDAYEAAWILRENGIPAVPIGILTGRRRRVIHFGFRVRYLDKPRKQEAGDRFS